jgi:hypothetical protein
MCAGEGGRSADAIKASLQSRPSMQPNQDAIGISPPGQPEVLVPSRGFSEFLGSPAVYSNISSYSSAVLRVFPAVVFLQVFLFTQYLTVEQPCGGTKIDQEDPIWEYQ